MPLRLAEQRQLRGPQIRRGDRRREQPLEAREQPVDGRGVEQIGGVLDDACEPAVLLREVDREIELRRRPRETHRPQAQVLDFQLADGSVLQDEHHLEQRGVGEAPFRRQLLDQLFERHLLVQIGGERGLAGPAEQLAERGAERGIAGPAPRQVSGPITPQHQGVDEEPDERLDLPAVAAGHGRAHGEIVLAAAGVRGGSGSRPGAP